MYIIYYERTRVFLSFNQIREAVQDAKCRLCFTGKDVDHKVKTYMLILS